MVKNGCTFGNNKHFMLISLGEYLIVKQGFNEIIALGLIKLKRIYLIIRVKKKKEV